VGRSPTKVKKLLVKRSFLKKGLKERTCAKTFKKSLTKSELTEKDVEELSEKIDESLAEEKIKYHPSKSSFTLIHQYLLPFFIEN
jgi:transcriptional regulator NrdR family protein